MASISYRFQDIAAYWSKITSFCYPLYLAPPFRVKPSDLRNDLWCRKTRMLGLSDGERISMVRSTVFDWSTRVTDGRTDGRTDRQTDGRAIAYSALSMLSRAKKSKKFDMLKDQNYFDRSRVRVLTDRQTDGRNCRSTMTLYARAFNNNVVTFYEVNQCITRKFS